MSAIRTSMVGEGLLSLFLRGAPSRKEGLFSLTLYLDSCYHPCEHGSRV